MEAAIPDASSIRVNFGEKQPTPTPIDISMNVDFFSPEYDSIRNDFAKKYQGANIPKTCLAFEIQVDKDIEARTEQLKKLASEIIPAQQKQQNQITVCHSTDHILIYLQNPNVTETGSQLEQMTAQLKNCSGKENNQINLRVSSHNDANTIFNRVTQDGAQASIFNSLHFQFEFVKTELISKFIGIVFENILGIGQFNNLLESFKKLNIELNFASGSYLKEFPKVKMFNEHPPPPPEKNPVAEFLMNAGLQKGRFFLFNPSVMMKGNVYADGFVAVLKAVHGV